jgi:hypothetical protein
MMRAKVETLNLERISTAWILAILHHKFNNDENITALKILTILKINIKDQVHQLKYKAHRLRINQALNELASRAHLAIKISKHDTLTLRRSFQISKVIVTRILPGMGNSRPHIF